MEIRYGMLYVFVLELIVFKLASTADCCVEIAQLPLCVCRVHPPLTAVVVVEDLLVFSRF